MSSTTQQAAIEPARDALHNGKPQLASSLAGEILTRAPDDIDAIEVAAIAAAMMGEPRIAEDHFRRVLALDPSANWARGDLARLLLEEGRLQEAETVVRQALAIDDGHADAHALFGTMLAGREMLVEAGWHFERAMTLAGRHPDLLVNLGRTLLRRGHPDEAGRLAMEAMQRAPQLLSAAILAADAAERRGDRREAAQWLDRAEPLARHAGLDVLLARATLLSEGEEWPRTLDLLDRTAGLSGTARLLRGRLRDRAHRHEEAWADFVAGKAALARPHDRAAVEASLTALATASRSRPPPATVRKDTPQPIFILGAPRSGTTMTEQVLAAHSAIRAGGELPFVTEMRALAETLTGAPLAECFSTLSAADRRHIPALLRDLYLTRAEHYGLTAPGAAFFTDKTPLSEAYLPLIRLAFPEAPLVLVRRHPLDVLVSAMGHDMTHGFHAFYDAQDAAHHLALTGRLVRQYRDTLGIVPHLFAYERFVADQAGETGRLMTHLGLAPEPAQAAFHILSRHAPTPSYAQVRAPLNDRSIGRWKPYAAMLAPLVPLVSELIAEGGYEV